jgi:hypothetical protein
MRIANFTLWLLVIIVVGSAGVLGGYFWGHGSLSLPGCLSQEKCWQAAAEKAGNRFEQEPAIVKLISGTVVAKEVDHLVIKANPFVDNPFVDPGPEQRNIYYDEKTVFEKKIEKSPAKFAQDDTGGPFTTEKILFNDIKVDDVVSVESASDIKTATNITASAITVYKYFP